MGYTPGKKGLRSIVSNHFHEHLSFPISLFWPLSGCGREPSSHSIIDMASPVLYIVMSHHCILVKGPSQIWLLQRGNHWGQTECRVLAYEWCWLLHLAMEWFSLTCKFRSNTHRQKKTLTRLAYLHRSINVTVYLLKLSKSAISCGIELLAF